ncbi:MAG: hypothetical protein CL393_04730 [Acidiferrobacteraceae bacterium]|jgi:hypothetical protein|nr:hypothetical protein [Acidiferrobacteraceae bacterium]|tara:strand:- start:956 stop:1381 length:426 start_codon:yes stop_codon:yes gene_type:complete
MDIVQEQKRMHKCKALTLIFGLVLITASCASHIDQHFYGKRYGEYPVTTKSRVIKELAEDIGTVIHASRCKRVSEEEGEQSIGLLREAAKLEFQQNWSAFDDIEIDLRVFTQRASVGQISCRVFNQAKGRELLKRLFPWKF